MRVRLLIHHIKPKMEHKLFRFLSIGIGTLCTFTTGANPRRCHVVGAQGSFSSCFIVNAPLISTAPHRDTLPFISVSTVMTQMGDPAWSPQEIDLLVVTRAKPRDRPLGEVASRGWEPLQSCQHLVQSSCDLEMNKSCVLLRNCLFSFCLMKEKVFLSQLPPPGS